MLLFRELRESIEKDNPAVDALKQKLDVANRKLKRMALLKATADKAESERAANIPILHTKDNPQGDTGRLAFPVTSRVAGDRDGVGCVVVGFFSKKFLKLILTWASFLCRSL